MKNFNTELQELRLLRNQELVDSDWTQLPDSPITEAKKEEWKVYRQTLRDLLETESPKYNDNGQLMNVNWPTKPSD
jgi:hypothetical protein